MPPRVAILVTSCAQFHRTTVPILVHSVCQAGVSVEDVFVVAGDSPHPKGITQCTPWGKVRHVTWSNMDNNGLLWAVTKEGRDELAGRGYDWVLYLHDTTVVEPPAFRESFTECVPDDPEVMVAQLVPWPSMCMGYYRLSALWDSRVSGWLVQTMNHDTSEKARLLVKSTVEDSVFQRVRHVFGERSMVILNPKGMVHVGDATEPRADEPDKPGKPIRLEYAPRPGVLKRKSNWSAAPMRLDL